MSTMDPTFNTRPCLYVENNVCPTDTTKDLGRKSTYKKTYSEIKSTYDTAINDISKLTTTKQANWKSSYNPASGDDYELVKAYWAAMDLSEVINDDGAFNNDPTLNSTNYDAINMMAGEYNSYYVTTILAGVFCASLGTLSVYYLFRK